MAGNIAEIGFVANTAPLDTTVKKLDAMVPAAQRAERATAGVSGGLDRVAAAAGAASTATERAAKSATAYAAGAANEATAAGRAASANDNLANSLIRVSNAQERVNRLTGVSGLAGKSARDSAAIFEQAAALDALRMKYNPLFNVIRSYKNEIADIRLAYRQGAISVDEMTAAINRQRSAALANIAVIKRVGVTNGNTAFNTANLAAQFQDVAVTAAMGMNPLQIALQQGTQMALIFGAGGATSALDVFKGALKSIISPLSLTIIGLVALAAAALQFINWAKVGQALLYGMATALENLAVPLSIVAAGFALAFAPAILTAIANITLSIAGGLVSAIGLLISTLGIIPSAFIALTVGLSFFRDEITQFFGVDIVGVVKAAGNYIIQAMHATWNAVVAIVANIPNAIAGAAIGIANGVLNIVNTIIQTIVAGINKVIEGVNYLRSIAGMAEIGKVEVSGIATFENPYGDKFFSNMADLAKKNGELAGKDYIGGWVTGIQDAANAGGAAMRKYADGLGKDADKGAKAYKRIVEGAKSTIESLKTEQAAIGLSEFASLKLRRETELLNQAREAGITLTKGQREELLGLANDMASLEYAVNKQREMFDFAKGAVKSFASDVVSGLREGKNVFEAFGDAAMNVLNKITDKLLNDVIDAIFQVNNAANQGGSAGGGLGSGVLGFFGSMFGGGADVGMNSWNSGTSISGLFGFAKGGAFTNGIYDSPTPFAFASGGAFGVMGEAGPEAVMPLSRGPDGSLGVVNHANDNGFDNAPKVYVSVEINGVENASVSEENSVGPNGDQFKKFVIDTNREAIANGKYDTVNSARYNNRPSRVTR